MSELALVALAALSLGDCELTQERINAFHTPPSAEVAGYAGFALFEALSDLLIIKDVLTRNEVDELLATTASRLQTSPDEVGRLTADFVTQLGEK